MDADQIGVEPSRLVVARCARKRSRVAVADYIRCSPSYYADMELGQRTALPYLKWVAEFLDFPEEFFVQSPVLPPLAGSFSYRRKSSMKAMDRHSAESVGAIFASGLTDVIRKYVRMPEPSVPDLKPLAELSDALACAESASAAIREFFQMGDAPLRNALDLVESLGVLVFWIDGPTEFDGVSFWVNGQPYILLNRNVKDGYRVRFTTLHELAHLLLHRDVAVHGKLEDRQADSFASAMLMPIATFRRSASKNVVLSSLLEDRSIWGASARAQVRRAYDLRIITEWAYRDAFIRMNGRWGAMEPNAMTPEKSTVHSFLFEEAGDLGKYAEDLSLEAVLPYDLFLAAFPTAATYERSANSIPRFSPSSSA